MKLKTENIMDREMNNGRTEIFSRSGIHSPVTTKDCRIRGMKRPLQPQVQQTEHTATSGSFRSQISEHDPIKGEAG